MPVVQIVRRRGGRQEITFKRPTPKAPTPAPKLKVLKPRKPQIQFPPIAVTTAAADDLFTATFTAWREGLPLAVGVIDELRKTAKDAGLPKGAANRAATAHCSRPTYLKQLTEQNAMRYALDGSISGPVSDDHRQNACERLAEMTTDE